MAATVAVGQGQQVNVASLPLDSLNALKNQLDEELQTLSNSIGQLRVVRDKFSESKRSVESMKSQEEGAEMLVPVTPSLFVAGRVSAPGNVLVDIGTGYYVTKSSDAASDFFQRKVDFIKEQIEAISQIITTKQRQAEVVGITLQQRISAIRQQQAAAGGASSS